MGKLVLVVDDEEMTRRILATLLKLDGHECVEAEDGLEALEKAVALNPDAIILDVMMPVMDGITVCKKLRADPATAHVPIVMLSGRAQINAEGEGLEAGANAYMRKPIEPKKMLEILKDLMSRNSSSEPT
ncbi:MAG: response regulator [Chloroflexota bacterium]|jgi:CheY-like chemotaxis protein